MDEQIEDVRAFSRFYTRQIGLLNEHFNDSPLSLPEARVLYEIDTRGHTTGRELQEALGIDRGYLSRILRKFGDAGLTAISPNPGDRRSNTVALTTDGDIIAERLNQKSSDAVAELLRRLDSGERARLTAAMRTIRKILGDEVDGGPVILRPYRIGELGWLVHRQGLLYNQQYGWNGDFEALIARIYNEYATAPDTPPKNLWVAEYNGEVAGSIFVMPTDGIDGSAQLRMLYVEPAARGRGIGRMLVDQCVAFARGAGYERLRLWTHSIQSAARKLYAGAGFSIVEEWDHESFGKQLHAEIWELKF
jgi:DNA-binding MarR family transcriptional regulator/GNAT superfamily N-acetyltransferase